MSIVMHATDFSSAARPAFRVALRWARRRRARLHLVHVVTPPVVILEESFLSTRSWRRLEALELRAARRRLAALQALARRAGVATVATAVRSAIPVDAIVRAAGASAPTSSSWARMDDRDSRASCSAASPSAWSRWPPAPC